MLGWSARTAAAAGAARCGRDRPQINQRRHRSPANQFSCSRQSCLCSVCAFVRVLLSSAVSPPLLLLLLFAPRLHERGVGADGGVRGRPAQGQIWRLVHSRKQHPLHLHAETKSKTGGVNGDTRWIASLLLLLPFCSPTLALPATLPPPSPPSAIHCSRAPAAARTPRFIRNLQKDKTAASEIILFKLNLAS